MGSLVSVASEIPIRPEEVEQLIAYRDRAEHFFREVFQDAGDRFADGEKLIARFVNSVDKVLKDGLGFFSAVNETHNELCVAASILGRRELDVAKLEYEVTISNTERSIDFRVILSDGQECYVDVKSITPQNMDNHKRYLRDRTAGYITEDVDLTLFGDLGGHLYHYSVAARTRILEYTKELEEKVKAGGIKTSVLVLCSDGFRWSEDEFEDFVSRYKNGDHRVDDPFAKMEAHYMQSKDIILDGSITRFAYVERPKLQIEPKVNWIVLPPDDGLNSKK